ncbi:MAG TPA: decarboxylating 6-phosphogluconate dehydrogenase [Gemmatimonadaceae bacterium]|nr:decarboxylating 6-phosphogluconate dehydrogenase [Gemmatimonadaceae bacterium]
MQLAMIGLGKMGGNMTARLMRDGHSVVVYDHHAENVAKYVALGAKAATDLPNLTGQLSGPRIVWIMVPAGAPVDETITALLPGLKPGDIIIDGGNSNYKETRARAERLAAQKINFIDAGTSGGIWGLENGYCLMVGGPPEAVKTCEPIFLSLAQKGGYMHVGPAGSGHYVKMVHNGIEYGLLQAFAEGYEILAASSKYPDLDLHGIAELWQHGSVVRSWLNELAVRAFEKDPKLDKLKGYVSDSGEGRWTVAEAIEEDVPAPVITLSLLMRLRSRQEDSFGGKVIAALRNEFGGHAVKGT